MSIFFKSWDSIIRLVISSLVVYPFIIIALRIYGKRSLSKLNMFDFIVTLALGSIFASTVVSENVTVIDGILTFVLFLSAQYIVTRLALAIPMFDKIIKSEPTIVFQNGEFLEDYMRDVRVTKEEILYAIRQSGIGCLNDVDAVVMETNGMMSVLQSSDVQYSTLVGVKGARVDQKSKNRIEITH